MEASCKERREYECRLQRQMLLQKEVKELPKIVRDLITLISRLSRRKRVRIYIKGNTSSTFSDRKRTNSVHEV